MRYFGKILSVVLCVAEIGVLAQLPDIPSITSEKCTKALTTFKDSSSGRALERCSSLIEKKKYDEVCSDPQCLSVELPDDIKVQCKGENDELIIKAFNTAFDSFHKEMKNYCNNSSKPTVNVTSTATTNNSTSHVLKSTTNSQRPTVHIQKSTTKVNPTATTKISTTHASKSTTKSSKPTTKSSKPNPSTLNNSSANGGNVGAVGNPAPINSPPVNTSASNIPAGNAPAGNTPITNAGIPGSQTDPQISQINPITNANNTAADNTNTDANNDFNSSAGSKFTYSLVAAFALAAYNLLL